MTKNHNLQEIEMKLKNKAYLTFHGDGILEGMYRKVCKWLKLGTGLQSEWQAG